MSTATPPFPPPRPRHRTAAEWLHDLGDVPLDRIIFDPLPGTATEADLLRKVESEDQICELIDGTLVEKPMGLYESLIAMILVQELLNFIRPRNLGAISGEAGPFRLALGLVRLPDVAFISARKFAGIATLQPIPAMAPDLAIEVISKSNTRREIERKRNEYFAADTRLVWVIDPATRSAEIYASPSNVQHIDVDGVLDGKDVLPGFQLRLGELFAAADQMIKGAGPS